MIAQFVAEVRLFSSPFNFCEGHNCKLFFLLQITLCIAKFKYISSVASLPVTSLYDMGSNKPVCSLVSTLNFGANAPCSPPCSVLSTAKCAGSLSALFSPLAKQESKHRLPFPVPQNAASDLGWLMRYKVNT